MTSQAGLLRFDFQLKEEIFTLSKASRPALKPIQLAIQCVVWAFPQGKAVRA
jgi:hypothetical protein